MEFSGIVSADAKFTINITNTAIIKLIFFVIMALSNFTPNHGLARPV